MSRSTFTASVVLSIALLFLTPGCRESKPALDTGEAASALQPADAGPAGDTTIEKPAVRTKPMKGVELYCWQENGESLYAALIGTNRMKGEAEIRAAAVKSLDDLKKALGAYAEGTHVVTVKDRPIGNLALTGIASPSEYKDLQEHLRKLGLRLDF